jgi:hypothetical protein
VLTRCIAFGGALLIGACSALPPGILYSNTTTPKSVLDAYPWNESKACGWWILGLISVGDTGVRAAMRAGHLGRAALVETQVSGGLGVYRVCTVVYGPYGDLGPPPDKGP